MPDITAQTDQDTTTDQDTDDDRPLTADERLLLAGVFGLLTGMAQR